VNLVTVLGAIFFLGGVILAVLAIWRLVGRIEFVRNSKVVPGLVVGMREERDGIEVRHFRWPRVRFRTLDGREVTFESDMASSGAACQVGDPVSVRYQRDHPETAEFDSVVALWGPTLLFTLLAATFLAVGTGLWFGFIPV
jgi:hypothetical protein